jgi:hypothetical protein
VELPEEIGSEGRTVEIAWTCQPHAVAGDSRQLGLPVFAAKVASVRMPKPGVASTPQSSSSD